MARHEQLRDDVHVVTTAKKKKTKNVYIPRIIIHKREIERKKKKKKLYSSSSSIYNTFIYLRTQVIIIDFGLQLGHVQLLFSTLRGGVYRVTLSHITFFFFLFFYLLESFFFLFTPEMDVEL